MADHTDLFAWERERRRLLNKLAETEALLFLARRRLEALQAVTQIGAEDEDFPGCFW